MISDKTLTETTIAPKTRRKAQSRTDNAGKSAGRNFSFIWLLMILVVGMLIGALVARQHYKAKDIVVAVNGVTIDKQELFRHLEAMAGPKAVHDMVNNLMEIQYARKIGVAPTNAQVNAQYDLLAKEPGFARSLSQNYQTPEDVKTAIRASLSQIAILTKGVNATDAEIRNYYQQNIKPNNPRARFYTPETVRIAVIVTNTQAAGQNAIKAMNNGMSFQNAAKNFSVDVSTNSNGGVLPLIPRGRTKAASIPGFESAIFGMKIGQMIGPRKFAGKWWIIQCIDHQAAAVEPFNQAKDACRQAVLLSKVTKSDFESVQKGYGDFQKSSVIQAFWPEYKSAVTVQ